VVCNYFCCDKPVLQEELFLCGEQFNLFSESITKATELAMLFLVVFVAILAVIAVILTMLFWLVFIVVFCFLLLG